MVARSVVHANAYPTVILKNVEEPITSRHPFCPTCMRREQVESGLVSPPLFIPVNPEVASIQDIQPGVIPRYSTGDAGSRPQVEVGHEAARLAVPLSRRALDVLEEARSLDDGPGLIFPGRSGRPLSDMTFTVLLRRLNIPCVPHGFRSSFRDWAAEKTDAPHAVMEAALAHVVGDSTEAAYFRSDLFERRRTLMDQWAEYVGVG